ncbi:FHA domain-containing protein [Fibrella aquatilis]|uniref:FHA domain-containing protein n=1 Tax=Fibrella aquatilis TaxID=2817059 RepID=A0A939GDD2_9BACT|nr:FHA domain-containing protein [Fibrella aquatilis]MBO0934308.1 FHA domain-containing protein [Fibrella aquatilis]
MEKKPNRFLQQLGNLIIPKAETDAAPTIVSNERILHDIIACFDQSLARETVGTRLLFDSHFLVILHPAAYEERLAALPVIVDEAVRTFYAHLKQRKRPQDTIVPVASHWYFKFGPGKEYNGRDIGPGDMAVIGSLSGNAVGGEVAKPAPPAPARPMNVKATRKVKNTNVYNTLDTNMLAFSHIDFRESGAFSVKIDFEQFVEPVAEPLPAPTSAATETPAVPQATPPTSAAPSHKPLVGPAPVATAVRKEQLAALAKIESYMADSNVEETYWMQDREVVLARREPDNEPFPNYIRLDSAYVSNPHARIRYNDTLQAFELASFSRNETRINEQIVERSDPANPLWVALPRKAQILLNGVVTLTFEGLI